VAQAALADVAADLKQAEELYGAGQYAQAEQVYLKVLNEADPGKPGESELAFQARKKLPSIYIATNRPPQAQATVRQLLAKHADHERLPHAVHEIIEQAKGLDRTLEAGQVYQSILTTQPGHPQAIWLKMGIAIANAHLGNDEAVDSALQNIIAQHGADERATEAFGQTAWAYRKLEQFAKARTIYQYVVDNWSNRNRAIFSQTGIVLCSLELKEPEVVDAATQRLLETFAGDKNVVEVVWRIAKIHRQKRDWQRLRPLCRYILDHHGEAEEAIQAQQALIFASIDEEDTMGIEAGLQSLLARFSSDSAMPAVLYPVARKLNRKNDAKAGELYQYILDQHAGHEYVPFAKVNLGQIQIRQGDDAAAEAIFEKALRDYKDHPRLAETIHLMAEGYYDQAAVEERQDREKEPSARKAVLSDRCKLHYQKAMEKWEAILSQLPEHPVVTPRAHHFAGECHRKLDQPEKTIAYFQKVCDNWPDYEYAWHLQLMVAKLYKGLLRSGDIPAAEASIKIEAALAAVLQKYPNSPAAKAASDSLPFSVRLREGEQR
jgi:tetratricopeptide (TPR) repeat protein